MKKFLILQVLISMLTISFAQAAVVGYKFNSLECAEWDPFLLGDRCLMTVTNENKKLIIDFDFDAFNDVFGGEDQGYFQNKVILIDTKDLEKLSTWEEVREIRKYVPQSFNKAKVRQLDPSLITVAQDDQD